MAENRALLHSGAVLLVLLLSAATDMKYRKIYWWESAVLLGTGFIPENRDFVHMMAEALLMLTCLLLVYALTNSPSGGGDIKMYCALSFTLGLIITCLIMALVVLMSAANERIMKYKRGTAIPVACFTLPAYTIYLSFLQILNN